MTWNIYLEKHDGPLPDEMTFRAHDSEPLNKKDHVLIVISVRKEELAQYPTLEEALFLEMVYRLEQRRMHRNYMR